MSTYFPSGKDLAGKRKWYVVDAAGQTVGHLASEVASILSGKRNPAWTPFMDMGDHVIVINARQAVLKLVPERLVFSPVTTPAGDRVYEFRGAGRLDPILNGLVTGLPKNQLPKAVVAPTGDAAVCEESR